MPGCDGKKGRGGRCTCPRCAAAGDTAWPGRGRGRKWAGPQVASGLKWATGPQVETGPQVAGLQVAGPQVAGLQVAGPQVATGLQRATGPQVAMGPWWATGPQVGDGAVAGP
ncbi:unnamed protein product [Closterium sp. NIES-65]|nr:unnamed protein product [Closterium sp. NIES-65]